MPPPRPAHPPWTGAVLTGGRSTRMGRDKALVEVGGEALATRAARALVAAGAGRVLAVGGDLPRLRALGLEAVSDRHPGAGPLGGLLTALEAAATDVVVVLACDLPAADATAVTVVLDALLAAPDAAVAWPEVDGRPQVLHAAWRSSAARPALTAAFAAGERSPRRAAGDLHRVPVLGVDEVLLRDADRPEDLPHPSPLRRLAP